MPYAGWKDWGNSVMAKVPVVWTRRAGKKQLITTPEPRTIRPKCESYTALNIRHELLPVIYAAIAAVETLLGFGHPAIIFRNLTGGLRELIEARASIELATMNAEEEVAS